MLAYWSSLINPNCNSFSTRSCGVRSMAAPAQFAKLREGKDGYCDDELDASEDKEGLALVRMPRPLKSTILARGTIFFDEATYA